MVTKKKVVTHQIKEVRGVGNFYPATGDSEFYQVVCTCLWMSDTFTDYEVRGQVLGSHKAQETKKAKEEKSRKRSERKEKQHAD